MRVASVGCRAYPLGSSAVGRYCFRPGDGFTPAVDDSAPESRPIGSVGPNVAPLATSTGPAPVVGPVADAPIGSSDPGYTA